MRNLARIFRLTGTECRLLAKAFGWLVAARLGLMLFPVRTLCRHVNGRQGANPAAFTLQQATWAIAAAARRLPGTRCLAQSLALQGLLQEAGIQSQLYFGVAKDTVSGLIAHAWVVCEGEPVTFDEDLSRFTALPLLRG